MTNVTVAFDVKEKDTNIAQGIVTLTAISFFMLKWI